MLAIQIFADNPLVCIAINNRRVNVNIRFAVIIRDPNVLQIAPLVLGVSSSADLSAAAAGRRLLQPPPTDLPGHGRRLFQPPLTHMVPESVA